MEEAQTVNLDIAAATARFMQADAQARDRRRGAVAELSAAPARRPIPAPPARSSSGLTNGGREVVNYSASLSASYELDFWGKNRDAAQAAEETAIANRFDRDVVALTTLTTRRQRLFPGAGRAGPAPHRAAQHRQRRSASSMRSSSGCRPAPAPISTSRSRRACSPTSARWCRRCGRRCDQNINALATLVSRPPESVRGQRRLAQPDRARRASRPACRRNC